MNATDLDADYASAGFGAHLACGKRPAVLLVDVCRAYVDPASPLYARGEAAVAANVALVEAARAVGAPVIFTRVEYMPGGLNGGVFWRKVPGLSAFLRGSPLAEFIDTLRPAPDDIVLTKQYPSAFFGTGLAATLTAAGVDTVFVAGFSTSGCVRASALDAMQHGFIPFVVRDGCADRDERPHEANLFDLQAKYAEVVGLEAACALLAACPAADGSLGTEKA